jgi:hypothetical protein
MELSFDRWVRALKPEDQGLPMDTVLPPIDILMVGFKTESRLRTIVLKETSDFRSGTPIC